MAADELEIKHLSAQERYVAVIPVPPESDHPERQAGYIDYMSEPDKVVITHTVIRDEFGGRGYAGRLAKHVLDDIRDSGKKVVPVCSYIQNYIEKHPEYADLALEVPR